MYTRFQLSALLLALLLLLPKPILAQTADTPMPLPDLLIYGVASEENGQPATGSVTVQLPRGHVITTPIDEISGTDYGFVLPVPISMYHPNATNFAKDSAIQGEQISFLVNNRPAFLQAPDGSTIPTYKIPTGGFGQGELVDLIIAGPDRYTAGDVNANGPRDAADAMLALKYDIGLIFGSQEFPPPPAQIYLPLCDIVEDGACDSSDALRILQCDVGRTDVDCPLGMVGEGAFAGASPQLAASEVRLRKAVTAAAAEEEDAELITLAIMLEDSTNQFGALSATVAYDRSLLTPVRCDANPAQALDMGICNLAYDQNRVRFNAFTTTSNGNNGALVELTFKRATAAGGEADSEMFTLEETSVYDGSGTQIAWSAPQVVQPDSEQPHTGQPDTEQPFQSSTTIFMPILQNGNATLSVAGTTENRAAGESSILYMPIVVAERIQVAEQVESAAAQPKPEQSQPELPEPERERVAPYQVDADRRTYLPSILNGSD